MQKIKNNGIEKIRKIYLNERPSSKHFEDINTQWDLDYNGKTNNPVEDMDSQLWMSSDDIKRIKTYTAK